MNQAKVTKRGGQILAAACCLVLVWPAGGAATAGSAQAATWQRHNVLLELHDLPKRYSCNDLWYKFRDVLLRLGARPNMDILPYRCERGRGRSAFSPRVRLEFYAPRRLPAAPAGGASLRVRAQDIRIAPGEPASIDASDCTLLRQMKAALPGRILQFHLACRAPSVSKPPFSITVQALIPVPQPLQAHLAPT
jgi:hypothetical protein